MSYIPKGCDQQGRYPQAAESATDLGADQDDDFVDDLIPVALTIAAVGVLAIVVSVAAMLFGK